MARIFAIADLHLSSSGSKPMDVFGEVWRDHAGAMARGWDAIVAPGDTVLIPGDISWAKTLDEAREDLAWIGSRPGAKYLLRGNHDSWWGSIARVREALLPGCMALQNDAFDLGGVVLVGARGWTEPDDPIATEDDAAVFRRELERLKLSIADADRRRPSAVPRIAMLHFPPWIDGRPPSEVVSVLRQGRVTHCVYGHLHGADHAKGVSGTRDGIAFHLVSADAIRFTPVAIEI
jgi:predicted phosphohydrolase